MSGLTDAAYKFGPDWERHCHMPSMKKLPELEQANTCEGCGEGCPACDPDEWEDDCDQEVDDEPDSFNSPEVQAWIDQAEDEGWI